MLGAVLLLAALRAARLYHRALDERRRLAEARAFELDHFAARVAHDLKAPLASVVLGSSVAAEYPEEAARTLQKIQRASRLMGQMVDALLAVARVEPERDREATTAVAPVLDVIVDEVGPTATGAGAVLRVEPFSASATVACSAGVLASVKRITASRSDTRTMIRRSAGRAADVLDRVVQQIRQQRQIERARPLTGDGQTARRQRRRTARRLVGARLRLVLLGGAATRRRRGARTRGQLIARRALRAPG